MSKYCAVEIDEIIKMEGNIPFDVYIRLSEEKIIKLEHESSDAKQRLVEYKSKGLKQVVVLKEQYLEYVKSFKENFSNKFFAPGKKQSTDKIMEALDKGHKIAKTTFQNVGFNEDAIDIAAQVNKESIKVIQQTPNIFKFFNDFKERASKDFLKAMLTSFTMTTIIDTFDWSTEPIKEKSSLAVMLLDVLLEPHEIEIAKNREAIPKDKLDPKIMNHPMETSRMLNKKGTSLPRETIIIIEQHHERPDGKGYPLGMNHTNINILSACYIVSCHFVDLLVINQFNPEQKDEILGELFEEYAMGNYKKAVRALQKILG